VRAVGFSTGAVAYSNFRGALQLLAHTTATAVELSALRANELAPLVEAVPTLEVGHYAHVSVHLPSAFVQEFEHELLSLVERIPADWLLIAHPDVIRNSDSWQRLGNRVCIENMDKRKPIGQTRRDLLTIFEELPDATFCFDIGHAHQIDPTMGEAVLIVEEFGDKLQELHISEVNSESKHDPISLEAQRSFEVIAPLIPPTVPIIIESRVADPGEPLGDLVHNRIEQEIELVRRLLSTPAQIAAD
jgi:hypothetical protein